MTTQTKGKSKTHKKILDMGKEIVNSIFTNLNQQK